MSSSATSSNQNPSQNSGPEVPTQTNTSNQDKEPNPEPHQRNPQGEDLPRAYKLGAEADSGTELQKYDERARIWIMIYVCWLAWNIYTCCPYFSEDVLEPLLEFKFGLSIGHLIGPLFLGAPYFFQLWGLIRRSVKATNRGIKILCFYGVFATIGFVFGCFMVAYAKELYKLSLLGQEYMREKMPYHPHMAYMDDFPSREEFKEMKWGMFKQTGKTFAYYVVGYVAARKFRNHLNEKEKFLKKN